MLALKGTVEGTYSAGDFILIVSFVGSIFPKFNELIYQFREIAKYQTDLEKYSTLLNEEMQIKEPLHPKKIKHLQGKIEFR